MAVRMTNNSIVRNYTSNLNSSLARLNTLTTRGSNGRRYNTLSENTSLGVRALQVRRAVDNNRSYKETTESVLSKFSAAEDQLSLVVTLGQDIADRYTQALNGSSGNDEYYALKQEMMALRDEILATANGRFTENYLFGGTNVTNRPFTMDTGLDGKETLFYNGIDVRQIADSNGNLKPEYQYLMDDASFVDIGLGLNSVNGSLVESSAFKSTLNGLEIFGMGDNNMILIINELIAEMDKPGFPISPSDGGNSFALLDKMRDAYNNVNLAITKLGADTQYLEYTKDRLESEYLNLVERQDQLEFVDPVQNLMELTMQEFSYNAALQMGQRLLQPTLFNFIN